MEIGFEIDFLHQELIDPEIRVNYKSLTEISTTGFAIIIYNNTAKGKKLFPRYIL